MIGQVSGIYRIALQDIKLKVKGNYLGVFWLIISPLISIFLPLIAFKYGLKTQDIHPQLPFAPWFITGMVIWLFSQDLIRSLVTITDDYAFLFKKIKFRLSLIPLIKITSSCIVNSVLFISLLLVLSYNHVLHINLPEFLYYIFCAIILSVNIGLLVLCLRPYFPDIKSMLDVFLQGMFWLTPIFWIDSILPKNVLYMLSFNGFAYIVEGFRHALLDVRPLSVELHLYFWIINLPLLAVILFLYRHMSKKFVDVI